jgi:hypothetical protein
MERIAMSQQERDELYWLKKAGEGAVTQREAGERIGISERWVRKLLRSMEEKGTRWWCMDSADDPPTGSCRRRREGKPWRC